MKHEGGQHHWRPLFETRWLGISGGVTNSSREHVAAGDRAAELNEQISEGHEWAAEEHLGGSADQHSNAASQHRRGRWERSV
jgi:hypothetical protein